MPDEFIAHYKITRKLGQGGMGEVYRATDTKLNREVAIKVLPESFSTDKERLVRFQREAEVLASLNHPNIAGIHGLEESDGQKALVLELVEGETLAKRLKKGALPVEDALEVCKQIAQALEAAHEKGIVHRDLKPGNIIVTSDGEAKVLDFGLAKEMTEAPSTEMKFADADSPTITDNYTKAGVILGTAAYMSPEQAKGKPIDNRTDVWSFGCVLYECLIGRQVFAGDSAIDAIGAILHKEPNWSALPKNTPPPIRLLLRKCLAKDQLQRLRHIGDALLDLDPTLGYQGDYQTLFASPIELNDAVGFGRKSKRLALSSLSVIVGVVIGWAVHLSISDSATPLRKYRLTIKDLQSEVAPAISPDGRKIVYGGETNLWVRNLDELEAYRLPGTEGAIRPFWSPNSEVVAFFKGDELLKMRPGSSQPQQIARLDNEPTDGLGGAWLENGEIILTTGVEQSKLLSVPAEGGTPRAVNFSYSEGSISRFKDPAPLPHGKGVILVLEKGRRRNDTLAVYAGNKLKDIKAFEERWITTPCYSTASEHIVVGRSGGPTRGIWAIPFSSSRMKVVGEPLPIAAGYSPSISASGIMVYIPAPERPHSTMRQLVWVDRTGSSTSTIGDPIEGLMAGTLSPDEKRIALIVAERDQIDLWLYDIEKALATRLTSTAEYEFSPIIWTLDGRIVFTRKVGTELKIFIINSDGRGEQELMTNAGVCDITRDGKILAYASERPDESVDLWYATLGKELSNSIPFRNSSANETDIRISPDQQLCAYVSDESGRDEVYIARFPSGEGQQLVSKSGGLNPRWTNGGKELLYSTIGRVMRVEIEQNGAIGKTEVAIDSQSLDVEMGLVFDISADGERFVLVRELDRGGQLKDSIVVVENWFEQFKEVQ